MRSLLDMARTHIADTGEDEWLREYEIAADAFRKANGDLLRELVQGGMDAGEFRPGDASLVERMVAAMIVEYLLLVNADPSYDRDDGVAGAHRRIRRLDSPAVGRTRAAFFRPNGNSKRIEFPRTKESPCARELRSSSCSCWAPT